MGRRRSSGARAPWHRCGRRSSRAAIRSSPQLLGDVHAALYQIGARGFHDITSGNNGAYKAGVGWDPCTGLGTPRGEALLAALAALRT